MMIIWPHQPLTNVVLTFIVLNLYTDTSGSLGYGGIYGFEWFSERGPMTGNNLILPHWNFSNCAECNQRITFFTDNAALVDIINRATSRDPTVMVFERQLVLACLNFSHACSRC